MTSHSHLDPDALARLHRFGGATLVYELIDLFSAGTPERLAAAHAAVDAGDSDGARGAFHALKSSAGQLGAVQMQALCEDAEQTAGRGDVAGAATLLAGIDVEWALVREHLATVREGAV